MALVPAAQPDPAKIRALIWNRGTSQADFARAIGRPPRTLYSILNDTPTPRASITLLRQIAMGLSTPHRRVRPSDISDWAGDDDIDDDIGSDAETKIPA
jgi:DNA-binding XRE family transcriptional regulator